ncbi:MAG: hypothetical protein QOD75_1447 [Blastocatellia bacterium]|nr:hypothetical protein [Blastocatellia bacterium]
MRQMRNFLMLSLALLALAAPGGLAVTEAHAQTQAQTQAGTGALQRGYRTGYSDGYASGFQDQAQNATRDFRSKEEFVSGNRNYASTYGSIEDYHEGYQQGFEAGYNSGFDRRGFDSTIPDSLTRRGSAATTAAVDDNDDPVTGGTSNSQVGNAQVNTPQANAQINSRQGSAVTIPRDTVMRVELLTNLSTDATQRGDRFQARVIEPGEFEGAILDGRVTQVKRAGRVKGNAQLQLTFEQIRLPDNRWANLSAQVIEVVPTNTSKGVGGVDSEGGVRGDSTTRSDVTKVGAATGIGAIIGAIAGGGHGAAIGAAIGAGIGTAGVITDEGEDIYLRQGQELKIRTGREATIG